MRAHGGGASFRPRSLVRPTRPRQQRQRPLLPLLAAAAAAVALCTSEAQAAPAAAAGEAEEERDAAERRIAPNQAEYAYLTRYGYIKESSDLAAISSPQAARQGIRQYQMMSGLQPTGYLDAATSRKMQQPRCGVPDLFSDGELLEADDGRPAAYVLPGGRWSKRSLTWRITKYTDDLPRTAQRHAVASALKVWLDASNLDIHETSSSEPDINIQFAPAEHGDRYPFDGAGGVLAHAFYPQSGAVHFDDDEEWTARGSRGINVERVAAHEFGHTLGLGHSGAPGALMSPYYSFQGESYALSDDDARGIQALYGKPASFAAATTTAAAPPTVPTSRAAFVAATSSQDVTAQRRVTGGSGGGSQDSSAAKQPNPCKARLDDITQWTDGRTYAFKDEWVYRFREKDLGVEAGYPRRSSSLFYRFPLKPEAVVFSWRTRALYAFKDRHVWKYSGYALLDGYPKRVSGFFPKLRAGLSLPADGSVLLISDKSVFKWDEAHGGLVSLSDNRGWSVSSYWRGAPTGIDSAYYDIHTRATVIFKGQTYYRYPDDLRGEQAPGYPRPTRAGWMGC